MRQPIPSRRGVAEGRGVSHYPMNKNEDWGVSHYPVNKKQSVRGVSHYPGNKNKALGVCRTITTFNKIISPRRGRG